MIELRGNYFDGKTSRAYAVTATLEDMTIAIKGKDINISDISLDACEIPPGLGRTMRSIVLPGGARLETDDLDGIRIVEKGLGKNSGMHIVNLLESNWRLVVACFAGLIMSTWLFIAYAIPFIADKAAASIPLIVTEKISDHTLEVLDEHFFKESSLDEAVAESLRESFKTLVTGKDDAFNFRLEFRSGKGMMGANAFALPSGMILMTDQLVELSEKREELLGILYHEITHVKKRHGMRSVLQNAGVFLLVSALAGDIASITSVASTFPTMLAQTGYLRDFEREADREAGLYMIEQGWGTKPLEEILGRITGGGLDIPGTSYLSTHPGTEERLKRLRALKTGEGIN